MGSQRAEAHRMEPLRLLPKPFVKRGQGVAALEGLHQRILPFLSQGPAIRLPDPRRGQSPPPFRPEPSWYKYSHTPAIVSDKHVRKGNVHMCTHTHRHKSKNNKNVTTAALALYQINVHTKSLKDMYRAFIKAKCAPRGVMTIVNCTVFF